MDYFEVDALNHSLLKQFKYSPRHYLAAKAAKSTPTTAMEFGTLVHGILLEDFQLEKDIIIMPDLDKKTKVYKEWLKTIDNTKLVVSKADYNIAKKMVNNLLAKKSFQKLWEQRIATEKAYYYNKDGVKCKAKIDILLLKGLLDVKTVAKINQRAIFNSIEEYDYHSQLAWYQEAADQIGKPCWIAAMEKSEPYDSIVYLIPPELIETGHRLNQERFSMYKYCTETGDWFGYEDRIHELEIPSWWLKNNLILGDNIL